MAAGPDKVIWIKIVPLPQSTEIRVYFKAETSTPGTFKHGFFKLENNNQKKGWAKLLIDKIIVPGATMTYTLTDNNATNTKYEFQDTFSPGGIALPVEITDPADCNHQTASNLA